MQVDWKQFLRDHHIGLSGKVRKGVYLECNCPFCHNDTNYHGAVNIKTNSYNCFKCGRHSFFDFVSVVSGCLSESREVFKALKEYRSGADFDFVVPREEQEEVLEIKKNLKMPGTSPLSKPYRNYLIKRGLNPDYMEKHYGLKAGGLAGEWGYRLMVPVYEDGVLVAWQGRAISPNEKIRYKSSALSEANNIKDFVFNVDNIRGDTCVIVEGVFDVFAVGAGAVALCGISVKDAQLQKIADKCKNVYVLFDSEPVAQQKAMVVMKKLIALGCHAVNITVSEFQGKDCGEMNKEEILQIRRELLNDNTGECAWLL